jgi:hypothetical protein
MSAVTAPTWGDVISKVLEGIRTIVYNIASTFANYAGTIAELVVAGAIVGLAGYLLFRAFPGLATLVRRLGGLF